MLLINERHDGESEENLQKHITNMNDDDDDCFYYYKRWVCTLD